MHLLYSMIACDENISTKQIHFLFTVRFVVMHSIYHIGDHEQYTSIELNNHHQSAGEQ